LSGAVTDATPYAAATQLSVDEVGHEIQLEALASVCIIQRVIAAVGIILCMFGSNHSNLGNLGASTVLVHLPVRRGGLSQENSAVSAMSCRQSLMNKVKQCDSSS
jgi:hypothetical protein